MRLFVAAYVLVSCTIVAALAYLCYACDEWTPPACPLDLTPRELSYALRHPFSAPVIPPSQRLRNTGEGGDRADASDGL